MSVLFNVRRIDTALLSVLRQDESLVAGLCDSAFDFDLERFVAASVAGMSPERAAKQSAAIRERRSTFLTIERRDEARGALANAGVKVEVIAPALRLERSWWAMEAMIANEVGQRIIDQKAGESLGDDVGYGPAQVFLAPELAAIGDVLMSLMRDVVRPRFVAFEAADRAEQTARGFDVAPPCSEEDFDRWSWEPLCRLRVLVAETARAGDALLRWYD